MPIRHYPRDSAVCHLEKYCSHVNVELVNTKSTQIGSPKKPRERWSEADNCEYKGSCGPIKSVPHPSDSDDESMSGKTYVVMAGLLVTDL